MKILAILTPVATATPGDFAPHMVAEERLVWAAYREGVLREMYFQPDPLTVCLVFEMASAAEVQARLATFPMVESGLLDIRTVVLGPWLPLEALFDPAHRTTPPNG